MAAARRRGQRTSAALAAVMVSSGPAALVLCHDLLGQVPGGPVGAEVGGDPVRSDFQRRVEPHAQRWPPYVPGHEPRVEDDVAPLVVGTGQLSVQAPVDARVPHPVAVGCDGLGRAQPELTFSRALPDARRPAGYQSAPDGRTGDPLAAEAFGDAPAEARLSGAGEPGKDQVHPPEAVACALARYFSIAASTIFIVLASPRRTSAGADRIASQSAGRLSKMASDVEKMNG